MCLGRASIEELLEAMEGRPLSAASPNRWCGDSRRDSQGLEAMEAALVGGLIGAVGVVSGVLLTQWLHEVARGSRQLREEISEIKYILFMSQKSLADRSVRGPDFINNMGKLILLSNSMTVAVQGQPWWRRRRISRPMTRVSAMLSAVFVRTDEPDKEPVSQEELRALARALNQLDKVLGRDVNEVAEYARWRDHFVDNGLDNPPSS